MNVEMPDGTIIQDVPEGISKSELMTKLGRLKGQPTPAEPLAQRMITGASNLTGIPRGVVQGAAAMPLPMIAAGAGAAAGALTSPVTGPVGPIAGGMAGSVAGEAGNQALGITEPSTGDLVAAGAIPGGLSAIGAIGRKVVPGIVKSLPGASVALHEAAQKAVEQLKQTYQVTSDLVDQAYKRVAQYGNPLINVSGLKKRAEDMLGEVTKNPVESLRNATTVKQLEDTITTLADKGMKLPLDQARALQKDFGLMAKDVSNAAQGRWSELRKAVSSDLEHSTEPGALALQDANRLARRHYASDELDDVFTKAFKQKGDNLQFNRNKVLDELRTNPDIAKGMNPADLKELRKAVDVIGDLPPLPSGAGSWARESSRLTVPGAVGAVAAKTVGVDPWTGAMAGAVFAGALSKLLQTQPGRRAVIYLAQQNGGKLPSKELMSLVSGIVGASHSGPIQQSPVGQMTGFQMEQ